MNNPIVPINHNFSLVVGDYHNPEPWHDWIGGTGNTRLQVITDGQSSDVTGVDFSFSLDGVEWNSFYHDSDGTMLAENTTTQGPQGDGWAGYFSHSLIPQLDVLLGFKATATFSDGTSKEETRQIRFDSSPPSSIEINVEDFMNIQNNTIILDIEPGNCIDLSHVEIELVSKPENFNKGVPHITQPTGTTCAPTAAAACLKWFGGEVTGGLTDAELIEALKAACKTDQGKSGTNPDDLAKGLRDWIAAHGDGYTVRGPLPFDWKQMRNELERGQDVLSGIVWTGGGGHRMTFNSIKNTPEPDGKIRIDFMDPWTGQEEWGYVDPATGELTGFTGAGPGGTLGNIIIICPKETSPTPGTGTILPGPNPPAITIPVTSPGLYFLRINAVDNSGNVSRFDYVVNNEISLPHINEILDPQMHYTESIRLSGEDFGEPGPGNCIVFSGLGFCSPEIWTYWSDDQVFFNCPNVAPGMYNLQVQRNDGMLSNQIPVEILPPGEITFLSPDLNERIMNEFVDSRVVMPIASELVDSVRFYAAPTGSTDREYIGTDYDGTITSAGTYVPVGEGNGWFVRWYVPAFFDVFYTISAEGFGKNGMVYSGHVDFLWDALPYQINIREPESKTIGGKTPAEDSIRLVADIDETMLEEIFAGIRPLGGFDFTRPLVHIDQNDVEAKDADNKDISNDICGPVAAAVCLDWLNKRAGGTGYQSIQDSIRKIARKAGTKAGSGTWDDKLTEAINEMLKKDPKIKNGKATRYDKPNRPYNKIAKNLRDSADVIIMIHQKLKDGTIVGHYVTVSSHHTEISYQGIGPDGIYGCVAVQKDYIDFMDPATGETTYREAKWYNNPPTIADYDIGGQETDGEAWVESVIVVTGAESKNSRDNGYVWNSTITPNGAGQYVIYVPCSEIPEGVFAFELSGTTAKASIVMEYAVVVNGQYEPFANFTANQTIGVSPFTVQFTDLSLPADSVTSWNWDFGNGGLSGLKNPSNTFSIPGIYDVKLIVSDGKTSDTLVKPSYIEVTIPVCQTLSLSAGWSGISATIQPSNPDIPTMFNSITDDLVVLYNFDNVFYPDGGILPDKPWDSQSGYIVKMIQQAPLSVCGTILGSNIVSLNAGWNIMPVLSQEYVDVALTFGNVEPVKAAKDIGGVGVYWKAYVVNTLQWMLPGKAYFVYSTSDVDVLLQGSSSSTKSMTEEVPGIFTPWNKVYKTAESHVIIFTETSEMDILRGDIIGVVDALGVCCGITRYDGNSTGLLVFGDDPFTANSDGFENGESFNFSLFRPATNEQFNMKVNFEVTANSAGNFETNGLSLVKSVDLYPAENSEDDSFVGFELFPNPANDRITVKTNVLDAHLEIFNLSGALVYGTRLTGTDLDVSGLKPGIYFARLLTSKQPIIRKLVIE
jgi:PKD repeat protein